MGRVTFQADPELRDAIMHIILVQKDRRGLRNGECLMTLAQCMREIIRAGHMPRDAREYLLYALTEHLRDESPGAADTTIVRQ